MVNPKPIDYFYYESDGTPWDDTDEVIAGIPSGLRYIGQTVNVAFVEYSFYSGIADEDLLQKGGSSLTNGSGTTANGSAVDLGGTMTVDASFTVGSGLQFDVYSGQSSGGSINAYNFGATSSGASLNGYSGGGATSLHFGRSLTYGDGVKFSDGRTVKVGIEYVGDYSSTYTARSLTDKGYVDNAITSVSALPGLNFAPAQNFDPTFVVYSCAIVRASNTYTLNGAITYEILDHTSDHNSSLFQTAVPNGQNLEITHPPMRRVLNAQITPDETFTNYLTAAGPSVGLSSMIITIRRTGNVGVKLRGQGTNVWSFAGQTDSGNLTFSNFGASTAGNTDFYVSATNAMNFDAASVQITYVGTNNYGIRRAYSGLPGSYTVRFFLVDRATGLDVTTNPTTNDEVVISNCGNISRVLRFDIWKAENQFMAGPSSLANFWISAYYEAWIVAVPISSSVIQVRWQPSYPSATNYKIFRDTSSTFATETLVHTGTTGSFTDSGLATNTLYYYRLKAVVGGIDTVVSYFKTNTKAY
jgi:hypothetical protein